MIKDKESVERYQQWWSSLSEEDKVKTLIADNKKQRRFNYIGITLAIMGIAFVTSYYITTLFNN